VKQKINGVDYSYLDVGTGEVVLLLHGFTGSKETWQPLIESLSKKYRVIALDLLGHGETSSPIDKSRYQMEEAASEIKEFLEKLEIKSVHLLGYSMGGRLALYFALHYPTYVTSLILESCTPGLPKIEDRLARKEFDEKLATFILEKGIPAFVDKWENVALFHSQKSLPVKQQEEIRKGRLNQVPIGLSNSLKGMGTGVQPSLWEGIHQITAPTLLVCGELDEKFCLIMEKMIKRMNSARLEKVLNAGHAIHVEQEGKFVTIVSGFLNHIEKERFR
jgi:2-succinyl-6-hydroxy-2,4-cyclohexadiene-1-carboxylate synthase